MENKEELKEIVREVVREFINPNPSKEFRIDIKEGDIEDSEVCAICGTNKNLQDDQPWYYCSRCEGTYKKIISQCDELYEILKQTVIDFKVGLINDLPPELRKILPLSN